MLAVLLGSSLKFDGKFILQTRTDGPVDMLVVDYRTGGGIRAYARFDDAAVAAAEAAGAAAPGALARPRHARHDRRPGRPHEPLSGRRAARRREPGGGRPHLFPPVRADSHPRPPRRGRDPCARGRPSASPLARRRPAGAVPAARRRSACARPICRPATIRPRRPEPIEFVEDDAWTEAQSLVGTIQDDELTDPMVPVETLLFRLFHERGVRVYRAGRNPRRMLLLARARRRAARHLHGRGDRREHRGRRHLGHLRVLQQEIPLRPGGLCRQCRSTKPACSATPTFVIPAKAGIADGTVACAAVGCAAALGLRRGDGTWPLPSRAQNSIFPAASARRLATLHANSRG